MNSIRKQTTIRRVLLTACLGGTMASGLSAAEEGKDKLYDRLGGMPAVRMVVGDFVDKLLADARIAAWFGPAAADAKRAAAYKESLTSLVCQVTGGPCRYQGPDMMAAHQGRGVTGKAFDVVVEDLIAVLDGAKVPEREKKELLAILGPLKSAVVEK